MNEKTVKKAMLISIMTICIMALASCGSEAADKTSSDATNKAAATPTTTTTEAEEAETETTTTEVEITEAEPKPTTATTTRAVKTTKGERETTTTTTTKAVKTTKGEPKTTTTTTTKAVKTTKGEPETTTATTTKAVETTKGETKTTTAATAKAVKTTKGETKTTTTTTAVEEQAEDMYTVEECVRKLIEDYTGSEIVMFYYSYEAKIINCLTADGDSFVMLDNEFGVMALYEEGKLTNLNDYRIGDPVDIGDGFMYYIYYEPAE